MEGTGTKKNTMTTAENGITTIVCDKCGNKSTAKGEDPNLKFLFNEGWEINRRGKFKDLCLNCLPKKKQAVRLSITKMFQRPHSTKTV